MKKQISSYLLIVAVLGLIIWLWSEKIEPFNSFSLRFNDINFYVQKKAPHPDIIFVAIDEPSVNRYGRWPWKRKYVAQGLEHLKGAKVVLLDMIFSEPTSPEEDSLLGDAIVAQQNSVCGFFLRHQSTQMISALQEELLYDSALDLLQSQVLQEKEPAFVHALHAEINIERILSSCTMSGTFSTLRASDQLFRSYPIAFYYGDHLYPSLAVQGLRLYLNEDILRVDDHHVAIGEHRIALDEKGFVRLNYYEPSQYQTVSFIDLIDGKVSQEQVENKIVIVGITDVGVGDIRATPMGAMSGPLLHYTFISNVLSGHLIKEPRNVTLILLLLMALLPILMLHLSRRIAMRVVIYVVTYALLYIMIRWFFISKTIYIDAFFPLIALLLSAMVIEVSSFIRQEEQDRFIKHAFSNYLSPQLLSKLMASPESLSLGGEKKELSILFSDIRSFTTISEGMTPQELTSMINRYFTPMTESVLEHGGMLDKYIGDAVMAFFNAPVDLENHPDAACRSALNMIDRLDELNEVFADEGLPFIEIGIGINTAEVVVGNMGSTKRFNYTVIGDGVNLASRVEGLNKTYHSHILITEFTKAKISPHFLTRKLEAVKVKGKAESVVVYELLRDTETNRACVMAFNEAMEAYEKGDYAQAAEKFAIVSEKYDDQTAGLFCQKAKEADVHE